MIQATYNFVCFRGGMGHGRDQKFLLPFGAESMNGRMIVFASCLNFSQAVIESIPGREAESMDPKYVGMANVGNGKVWACS